MSGTSSKYDIRDQDRETQDKKEYTEARNRVIRALIYTLFSFWATTGAFVAGNLFPAYCPPHVEDCPAATGSILVELGLGAPLIIFTVGLAIYSVFCAVELSEVIDAQENRRRFPWMR